MLCGKPKNSWTFLLPKTLNYSPVKGRSPLCRPSVEAETTRRDNQLITFQLRLQPRGKNKTWLVSIPEAVSWKLEMQREQRRDFFREVVNCNLLGSRGHGSPRKHLSLVASVTASHSGLCETDGGSGGCLGAAQPLSCGPVLPSHPGRFFFFFSSKSFLLCWFLIYNCEHLSGSRKCS